MLNLFLLVDKETETRTDYPTHTVVISVTLDTLPVTSLVKPLEPIFLAVGVV